MHVRREPVRVRLVQDVLRLAYAALIVVAVYAAVTLPPPTTPAWLDVVGRAIAAIFAILVVLLVLRLLLPRPDLGAFIIAKDRQYWRWLAIVTLTEVAMHPIVRGPFWFLHSTRALYLRVLGARIAWDVGFHGEFRLREPTLVSIGSGSQIEPGVTIEGSLHGAGRVRIAEVILGQGCLVGAHSILMPGSVIGHDARIEPASIIGEDVRIGVGASIGEGVRLEKGVDLGSYVTVGTGAILAEGVRVGDRARVAAGAMVEPGTQIGERELWEGAPARRVTS